MQRTFRYIISAILALVALSCDKLRDDASFKYIPIPVPEMISARISALESAMKSSRASGLIEDAPESWDDMEGVVTRTYAVADPNTIDPETGEVGEYYQYWSEGDAISLFLTRANLKYVMNSYIDGNLDVGEFSLQGEKTESGEISTGYCYSVYPYKESTSISAKGKVTYEFPKTQHYSGDTYANGENGMIARATGVTIEDGVLYFQNFCSYLQLRLVATEGQPSRVKQITLTSNSSTILLSGPGQIEVSDAAGEPKVTMDREPDVEMKRQGSNQVILDCGNGVELSRDESNPTKFWFVVPGGISFDGGFSVSVIYDDYYFYRKSTQKTIGIQRSHIKPMATFKPVAMEANRPIRYKYNDQSSAEPLSLKNTFYGEGGVALDILGQVYDEETGEWVVMLSGTLKTIGDNSFMGPGGDLEYIKVDNADEAITISDFAFYNCTADYLEVHNSVDQIKANAFKNSTIADIYIDGSINSINTGVSSDSHIENLTVTGNVGTICEDAFDQKGESILKSIDIGGNVGTIEQKAFHACESLAEVNIGGNVDTIDKEAFSSCHNLEIVDIDGHVDIIESKAFYDNDKLHTIDITGDIEKIGQQAFYDCDALETLHIDGGISSIGQEAFAGCDILNFVSIEGNVGSIETRAFYDNDQLEFVDIHGNVGTIGEEVFSKCDELEKVHVTGNVETVGTKAFYDSDSLRELLIDGHVDVIKTEAFSSCDALETVNLYGDVKTIEEKAFFDSNQLKEVHITGNTDEILENAFASCDLLEKVTIDGDVAAIGKHAFNACKQLQNFSVKSVESIGLEAFIGCSALTVVNIPGVKYIDNGAFQNCTGITTINLDSIITIDDSAFWACSSLTRVDISANCTMIGEGAFCNAANLVEVYIYAVEPPFIKTDNFDSSYAFAGTHPDLVVYIPAGSTDIYLDDEIFDGQTFDDPTIEAEVNWWYEEYEDYLVEM